MISKSIRFIRWSKRIGLPGKNSKNFLAAAKEQVNKAASALEGIREEAKFGLRTTWDILNAQLTLVNARIALVIGQRERVVTTYNTLAAIGQLSATTLGLDVPLYQPADHYDRVQPPMDWR